MTRKGENSGRYGVVKVEILKWSQQNTQINFEKSGLIYMLMNGPLSIASLANAGLSWRKHVFETCLMGCSPTPRPTF